MAKYDVNIDLANETKKEMVDVLKMRMKLASKFCT